MNEIQHSKKIMASYGVGNIVSEILAAVLAVMLFAFYETEVGLNSSLTGIVLKIFAVWDATNDPIVGSRVNSIWSVHMTIPQPLV